MWVRTASRGEEGPGNRGGKAGSLMERGWEGPEAPRAGFTGLHPPQCRSRGPRRALGGGRPRGGAPPQEEKEHRMAPGTSLRTSVPLQPLVRRSAEIGPPGSPQNAGVRGFGTGSLLEPCRWVSSPSRAPRGLSSPTQQGEAGALTQALSTCGDPCPEPGLGSHWPPLGLRPTEAASSPGAALGRPPAQGQPWAGISFQRCG